MLEFEFYLKLHTSLLRLLDTEAMSVGQRDLALPCHHPGCLIANIFPGTILVYAKEHPPRQCLDIVCGLVWSRDGSSELFR